MVNIVVTTDPSLFTGIKMLCCVIFILWTNFFLWIWCDWHFDGCTLCVGESNNYELGFGDTCMD